MPLFYDTVQDTVVALQALAEYSVRTFNPEVNLQVNIGTKPPETVSINKENALHLKSIDVSITLWFDMLSYRFYIIFYKQFRVFYLRSVYCMLLIFNQSLKIDLIKFYVINLCLMFSLYRFEYMLYRCPLIHAYLPWLLDKLVYFNNALGRRPMP